MHFSVFCWTQVSGAFILTKSGVRLRVHVRAKLAMAFVAPGIKVVRDEVKGRCLEATKEFAVGTVAFTEDAIVFASFEEDEEVGDAPSKWDTITEDSLVAVGNPAVTTIIKTTGLCSVEEYTKMSLALEALPGVESLDTARNLLQLMVIFYAATAGCSAKSEDSSEDGDIGGHDCGRGDFETLSAEELVLRRGFNPQLAQQVTYLRELAPSQGIAKCVAAAVEFRKLFPKFKPLSLMSDEKVRVCPLLRPIALAFAVLCVLISHLRVRPGRTLYWVAE